MNALNVWRRIVVTLLTLISTVACGEEVLQVDPVAECANLKEADFSKVVDAPTRVEEATYTVASSERPAFCAVRGYVTPSVGFVLKLPATNWNGKFLEKGCGGFCGNFNQTTAGNASDIEPLHRGYAFVVFDGGHTHGVFDGLWAYNDLQSQFDFGVRAPHVAALASKAIIERYYKVPPSKSYFTGCSSGGQQALSEAQRFPWDFDGVIAGAPSPTFSGPMMYYLWAGRALAGTAREADLKLVHERALAKCDMDDGVKDGVIGDPVHCEFDPGELLCRAGQTKNCLMAKQVEAVRKVYSGPTNSKGERIYTGGPLPGSELNWISDEAVTAYVDTAGRVAPWSREYFAYAGFMPAPGPDWKPEDFDFDKDYKRLRLAESIFGAADNPDLRKFKGAGAKLIMYQGGADESDIPSDAIDYYETAEKTMGGRAATQKFFRLFVIPGMNHCISGAGAFAIDYLTYLEHWVEKGVPPDKMIGAHVKGISRAEANLLEYPLGPGVPISFTRPIYPYPTLSKFKGYGSPDDAANFGPVEP